MYRSDTNLKYCIFNHQLKFKILKNNLQNLEINIFYRKRLNRRPPFFIHVLRLCMKYMHEKRVDYFSSVYGIRLDLVLSEYNQMCYFYRLVYIIIINRSTELGSKSICRFLFRLIIMFTRSKKVVILIQVIDNCANLLN